LISGVLAALVKEQLTGFRRTFHQGKAQGFRQKPIANEARSLTGHPNVWVTGASCSRSISAMFAACAYQGRFESGLCLQGKRIWMHRGEYNRIGETCWCDRVRRSSVYDEAQFMTKLNGPFDPSGPRPLAWPNSPFEPTIVLPASLMSKLGP
jgi:hypothetical protein